MTGKSLIAITLAVALVMISSCSGCREDEGPILDEAQQVGRMEETLIGADEDYYQDMDYGISKDPEEVRKRLDKWMPGISAEDAVKAVVKGRNNWIVWTGGNDAMWDTLRAESFSSIDMLKVISSHPAQGYGRYNRFKYQGMINEPCFEQWTPPEGCDPKTDKWGCGDPDRFGIWVDKRVCEPDPFENEQKYPGVKIGARGREGFPVGSYYGWGTGIIGFRMFPNPDFDEAAEKAWDPYRYYTDPSYYNDRDLVRPYRVGQTCGLCHVGPNPTNPPEDPENPKWENLNSNPGNQYLWADRFIFWNSVHQRENFLYQLFQTYRPGAIDTSLVSNDNINNPRTQNAVYQFGPRMEVALKWGHEKLTGGELNNTQFNQYSPPVPKDSPLLDLYKSPDTVWTPHVLKDGADSVGGLGSLNRVFINVGMFSEEWLRNFQVFVGGPNVQPMEIAKAQKYSSYWRANEKQTVDLALFFLAATPPDYLSDAPGGPEILQERLDVAARKGLYDSPDAALTRGKEIFSDNCARCHSSKLPEEAYERFFPDGSTGPNYLDHWKAYWEWTKTDEFKAAMREVVFNEEDDFLKDNFLSNELRVPVTLLETNACSPLATNAIPNNVWDNFSSKSYKELPSVGTYKVHHPVTGEAYDYEMPAGGRGYTRVPSLVSLWSTAPYLLNNTVGKFYWTGSVEDRVAAYDDGITKMLWPEKRLGKQDFGMYGGDYGHTGSSDYEYQGETSGNAYAEHTYNRYGGNGKECRSNEIVTLSGKKHPAVIDKLTRESYFIIQVGFLPEPLKKLAGAFSWLPWADGEIRIGPIPKCTPTKLLSDIDSELSVDKLGAALVELTERLKYLPKDPSDEDLTKLAKPLLSVNKCLDFVVNRGHYFGTDFLPESEGEPGLSDEDKLALIEYLRTF